MYYYNVAKAYHCAGQIKKKHTRGAKKRWYLFYYDGFGTFVRERIPFYKVIYYKYFKHRYRWRTLTCIDCKTKFKALGKALCPNCGKI